MNALRLSKSERLHLDTIQRKCRKCGNWFYVESMLKRASRVGANIAAAKSGGGFMAGPNVGRYCPDCTTPNESPEDCNDER